MSLFRSEPKPCSARVEGMSEAFISVSQEPIADLFATRAEVTLTRSWYPDRATQECWDWLIKGTPRALTISATIASFQDFSASETITVKRCFPSMCAVQKPEPGGAHGFERLGVWFALADVEGWR